jgi:hypothetical protein
MFPNSSNPHNLIDQTPTFYCDKHLVTIHSIDRDISKWPSANQFEITLPREMRNVETVRLSEISLPAIRNRFSLARQNVRMRFRVDVGGVKDTVGSIITIQNGNYTPTQLAREIENRMNVVVQITSAYGDSSYNRFHVTYDTVGQVMVIGNDRDVFRLQFDSMEGLYVEDKGIGGRYANWGLGACLGFAKETYVAKHTASDPHFYHRDDTRWFAVDATSGGYIVTAPYSANCQSDDVVYMEVDRLNSMDELVPYPDTSVSAGYSVRRNQHAVVTHVAGRPNSCFAKIPLTGLDGAATNHALDSKTMNLSNVTQYNPPIERIDRMKFRFRSHSGETIDFGNRPVHFSLEFHCIRNEIRRGDSVRKPSVW